MKNAFFVKAMVRIEDKDQLYYMIDVSKINTRSANSKVNSRLTTSGALIFFK